MLLQANMVKRLTADKGGDLEAKTGESLRVKGIQCVPSTNDDYITITIDRVTVAFYRIKGKSGNQLGTLRFGVLKQNIMEFLTEQGVNVTIPIAEGQTLNVKRADEGGNVMLIYDRHSAGDIKATDPNGSESAIYTFLQYAKIGTTPVAAGDALIDTALSPKEFPDFPCAKVVPSRHTIELLGIAGSPFVAGQTESKGFASSFFKLIRDREVLFDTERHGIPFDGQRALAVSLEYISNFSLIGSCAEINLSATRVMGGLPLMFEPVLKFESGQELNAYLTLVKTSDGTWTDGADDQAFILRVRRQ